MFDNFEPNTTIILRDCYNNLLFTGKYRELPEVYERHAVEWFSIESEIVYIYINFAREV